METDELAALGMGRSGFVEEHGLFDERQREAAEQVERAVRESGLRTVRIGWADQHGAVRCKFVSTRNFLLALRNGIDFSGAVLSMDSGNHVFTPLFVAGGGFGIPELTGFPDVVLVPDPTTFRVLPWASETGWVLSDMYFNNGRAVPLSTRHVLRRQLARVHELGYEYVAGLEVEFYILKRESTRIGPEQTGWPPPPPDVSVVAQGYQFLSETRLNEVSGILSILRDNLEQVGLPLRSLEDEWGPGQTEITFDPLPGLAAADAMVLFRSAAKQVCHAHGYHATFMCRPALPNFFSNGWHLHQSLVDASDGRNLFASSGPEPVSELGRQYCAGLLEHAVPMTVFASPTITGYKRYRPYSFAPDRVTWAVENRGALVRIQGAPGDQGSHVENRLGEPAANPYLYMASNLAAGLDGITNEKSPPELVTTDPYAVEAPMLPASLWEAVDALAGDTFFRGALSDEVVDYVLAVKKSEIGRFLSEVTDWEQREYLDFF
ncbi:MAG: glutamine synthetase family protein [Candidatus Dormibacteraeota bacterium]|nr:glutamine synthetase family protein [Candidatus Dormibacteraeota bacterium]